MKNYAIGLDYGTDSVRAVLIDAASGKELASDVHWYQRWNDRQYCNPAINQFRQHPLDHIEGLEKTIRSVVQTSKASPSDIKGICIDTTGSSPVPVTKDGTPLCMTSGFEDNPNAMMILWKDHTAIAEAAEINELAGHWDGPDYTKYEGGIYSSEWFWAKILHVVRNDEAVRNAAYTWLEHCDLMTYILIENKDLASFKRSRCAAGHKAMWHPAWGGLPSEAFLGKLDPCLATLRGRLYEHTYTSDQVAGHLSAAWAERLGLSTDTVIAVGTFDAHSGGLGARVDQHTLVKVMGTSTCDMIVSSPDIIGENTVKGICGQVDGSIIPGLIGLEAGQSAFGDLLAWFRDMLMWPVDNMIQEADQKEQLRDKLHAGMIRALTDEAEKIPLSQSIPTALDWINGRRTPDANQALKSAISGLTLGATAPHIFKALINAICFGSKKIVDRFESEGIRIDKVVGIGGVARKSPFIMQTLANVLDKPIQVAVSDYAPALGAAIYAAVAAGIYPDVIEAGRHMGSDYEAEYFPEKDKVEIYARLMSEYDQLSSFVEKKGF